jgi:hypothetical protein
MEDRMSSEMHARWPWALASALALAAVPLPGHAQARVVVTPSVAVGTTYDSNILWQAVPQTDHVWRVSPSITFDRQAPRSASTAEASVDGEWFSHYGEFSTPAARQHAAMTTEWKPSGLTDVSLAAGYDNTLYPEELNLATGLALGRTRTWRIFGGPQIRRGLSRTWELESHYRLTNEDSELTSGLLTHEGELGVVHMMAGRDELRLRYVGALYQFTQFDHLTSNAALVGWTHLFSPTVQIVADGGMRWAAQQMRPEIDLQLIKRTTFMSMRGTYVMTRNTTYGLNQLITVHRSTFMFGYDRPHGFGLFGDAGVYYNRPENDALVRVYRGAAEVRVPLGPILSLWASYTFDLQRGTFATLLDPQTLSVTTTAADATLPTTLILSNRTGDVHRSAVLVRFVLARSLRPMAGTHQPKVTPGNQPEREPADAR